MDRAGTANMDRLTEVLERLVAGATAHQPPPPRDEFKAPRFEGTGDVEYFITQFLEVAGANNWQPGAAVIHLRAALKDTARDCGKAQTVDGIFANLRARFGLTAREAKAKLAVLRRDHKTTLQEHACEVERLVSTAYADLPAVHLQRMVIDTFHATIGDAYLQRHLLAIETPDLEAAVRAGNEYLQIRPIRHGGSGVRQVDGEPAEQEELTQIAQASTPPLQTLLQAMQKLAEEVSALKKDRNQEKAKKKGAKEVQCYGCNERGHIRKDCQTNPWPSKKKAASGNEESPQQ